MSNLNTKYVFFQKLLDYCLSLDEIFRYRALSLSEIDLSFDYDFLLETFGKDFSNLGLKKSYFNSLDICLELDSNSYKYIYILLDLSVLDNEKHVKFLKEYCLYGDGNIFISSNNYNLTSINYAYLSIYNVMFMIEDKVHNNGLNNLLINLETISNSVLFNIGDILVDLSDMFIKVNIPFYTLCNTDYKSLVDFIKGNNLNTSHLTLHMELTTFNSVRFFSQLIKYLLELNEYYGKTGLEFNIDISCPGYLFKTNESLNDLIIKLVELFNTPIKLNKYIISKEEGIVKELKTGNTCLYNDYKCFSEFSKLYFKL